MPGLLEEGRNPQAGAPAPAGRPLLQPGQPGGQGGPGQQEAQASPEKLTEAKAYIANGMNVIHGPKTRDIFVKKLKAGKPVDALGKTTFDLMIKLDTDAQSQAATVSKEAKFAAGNILMGELVDVGEASKAFPKKLGDVEKIAAFRIAVGKYMQFGYRNGTITATELKEASAVAEQQYPDFENEVSHFSKMAGPQQQGPPQQGPPQQPQQQGPPQQPRRQAPQPGVQQEQAPPAQWGPKNG